MWYDTTANFGFILVSYSSMLSIVTFVVISIRLVATLKVWENRKESRDGGSSKLAQNLCLLLTLLVLEWYPEDKDCVNMLQGSSISSNSWRHMGRAFPNPLKYSSIKAHRPLFRLPTIPIYCTRTLFVFQHFILFPYCWLSKSFYKYPSIPLPQVAPRYHFVPPPFQI